MNHRKRVLKILRTLTNKKVEKVLTTLGKKSMTVTQIYVTARMPQSDASNALGQLRKLEIVNYRKVGKFSYYSIDQQRLEEFDFLISKIV